MQDGVDVVVLGAEHGGKAAAVERFTAKATRPTMLVCYPTREGVEGLHRRLQRLPLAVLGRNVWLTSHMTVRPKGRPIRGSLAHIGTTDPKKVIYYNANYLAGAVMHERFRAVIESLHPSFETLMSASPIVGAKFPKDIPMRAVYLFSENGRHLYVGRTNKLRSRFGGHTNRSSRHYSAPFAFKMARQATGKIAPSYAAGEDSREGLMLNPEFMAAFDAAKARIRQMEFRYVEETDPTRQALLEAYCCIVLQTQFNDFENH